MFSAISVFNKTIGYETIFEGHLYFFGTRHGDLETLKKHYPFLEFRKLHQVHGCEVVESDASFQSPQRLVQADAHWTKNKNVALTIQTADCMPLLAADGDTLLAVHSGWRGTLLNVIGASLKLFKNRPVSIFVGPFIQKNSFEVGQEVADQFLSLNSNLVFPHLEQLPDKAQVDLALAAKFQIEGAGVPVARLEISSIDTKTNPEFASYRRDRPQSTRNISFVAKLK